ncbi:MAG: Asp-tRNA(Asn)/Glu-tRNA(Gln) amidotransferase subunit GatC [Balneolales bacterium]|nr:Asp-tRNA(Asn)/Glu-tRNA(Gln) amidotransferase subunit GatC [Balneolales bacterium]
MSVSEKDVRYVADLARLRLSEEEIQRIATDMNQILDYMEQLNELETDNVEPLEHVIELDSRLRKDIAKEPLPHQDALKNAPDADSDYFRVPKVIE